MRRAQLRPGRLGVDLRALMFGVGHADSVDENPDQARRKVQLGIFHLSWPRGLDQTDLDLWETLRMSASWTGLLDTTKRIASLNTKQLITITGIDQPPKGAQAAETELEARLSRMRKSRVEVSWQNKRRKLPMLYWYRTDASLGTTEAAVPRAFDRLLEPVLLGYSSLCERSELSGQAALWLHSAITGRMLKSDIATTALVEHYVRAGGHLQGAGRVLHAGLDGLARQGFLRNWQYVQSSGTIRFERKPAVVHQLDL